MKVNRGIVYSAGALLVLGVAAWWFISSGSSPSDSDNGSGRFVSRRIADAGPRPRRPKVKRQKISKEEARKIWQETHEKPDISVDENEVAQLDDLEKKVLKSLQDALDSNDFDFVREAIKLMKQMGERRVAASGGTRKAHWSSAVPKVLKQTAVDALGWFGQEAMSEMMDFMMDADVDIAQSATDQFELAMQDCTMADYERADIIKMVSQVITDADTLDWMLTEAQNARHSVGVDTFIYISQNGTDKAKEMLPDYVEMFTGEENIKTTSDLRQWLDDYPDEPDDEEFWGRMTED